MPSIPDAQAPSRAQCSKFRALRAGALCVVALVGCAPVDDVVFETFGPTGPAPTITLVAEGVSVSEDAARVDLTLRLEQPAPVTIPVTFHFEGIEAQDNCQKADFTSGQGLVQWEAGETEAVVQLWIEDDDLAETDERLKLVIDDVTGATLLGSREIEITILDNDRSDLIQASAHGAVPSLEEDQASALQAALDEAALGGGRGVVVLGAGSYLVGEITVPTGVTLSGRQATLVRPADFGAFFTVMAYHSGPLDSEPTLIEGITIDGQRELQGGYQDWERSGSHLIDVAGDAETAGRLRLTVEDVTFTSGTGDGISIGSQSDALLCNIVGHDIWRDVVGLHGGGSSLGLRSLNASATIGTSGLWLDGETPGFDMTRRVQIELEDVHLSTGDFEASITQNSTLVLRRVTMGRAPFRLLSPDSTVEIYESRIYMGIPGQPRGDDGERPAHNQWQIPHDVLVADSTLVVAEDVAEEDEPFVEEQRTLALGEVVWSLDNVTSVETEGHRLVFEDCTFEVDSMTVDPDDVVYAFQSPAEGGTVIVRSSDKTDDFTDWFDLDGAGCFDCVLED